MTIPLTKNQRELIDRLALAAMQAAAEVKRAEAQAEQAQAVVSAVTNCIVRDAGHETREGQEFKLVTGADGQVSIVLVETP